MQNSPVVKKICGLFVKKDEKSKIAAKNGC